MKFSLSEGKVQYDGGGDKQKRGLKEEAAEFWNLSRKMPSTPSLPAGGSASCRPILFRETESPLKCTAWQTGYMKLIMQV